MALLLLHFQIRLQGVDPFECVLGGSRLAGKEAGGPLFQRLLEGSLDLLGLEELEPLALDVLLLGCKGGLRCRPALLELRDVRLKLLAAGGDACGFELGGVPLGRQIDLADRSLEQWCLGNGIRLTLLLGMLSVRGLLLCLLRLAV